MKLKQISRRTVSVVLAVLMVLSTLLVGSISTVNAVGASSGIIPAGEHFYYDLTDYNGTISSSNAMNYISDNWTWTYTTSIPDNKIIDVTLTKAMNFNPPGNSSLGQIQAAGWNNFKTTVPEDGKNCVKVSSDGKSYTWTTYNGSGGGETTTGWAITGNINGTDNWTTDYNETSIKFTETSTNIYKADVSVTDSSKWFRIINSNNKQYGSSNTQNNYSLTTNGNKSSATALTTSENKDKALTIDENGDWSIYLDTSGSTPKVWYTAQTTVSKNWAIVGDTVTGGQNWLTTDYYNNANIKFTQDAANENLYTADVTTIDGHNYFRLIDSDNI
ncbi:MAG: hypothetical protein PUD24_04180, partial [Oscillospiraceae bacterium]|nr:hypothetical protein [Oscillospiraceae bacterium]